MAKEYKLQFRLPLVTEKYLSEEERQNFTKALEEYGPHNFWLYSLPNPHGVIVTEKQELDWYPHEVVCESAKEFEQLKTLGFYVKLYNLAFLLPPFSDVYNDWKKKYQSKAVADALLNYLTFSTSTTEDEYMDKLYWHAKRVEVDEKKYSSEKFAEPRKYTKCPTVRRMCCTPDEPKCLHKREFFPRFLRQTREEQYDSLSPD